MMKNMKKKLTAAAAVLTVGLLGVTAFATSEYKTPAEVAAGVTGRTVESVTEERAETGKTYGTIASEDGKLAEFKDGVLELRKDQLSDRVADGSMTQAQADEVLAAIEENQAVCDGTGSAGVGRGFGLGCGDAAACGENGVCTGEARGSGNGYRGNGGVCGGTCTNVGVCTNDGTCVGGNGGRGWGSRGGRGMCAAG